MKNCFLFLASLGLFQALQAQNAGEISKVTIPGGKAEFSLSYIPAGQLNIQSADGKSLDIQLDAFWIALGKSLTTSLSNSNTAEMTTTAAPGKTANTAPMRLPALPPSTWIIHGEWVRSMAYRQWR